MKKANRTFILKESLVFKGLLIAFTSILFTVKIATPFLHTHQFEQTPSKFATFSPEHCEACEYESTQATELASTIILPYNHFSFEIKVFTVISTFVNTTFAPTGSRAPPQVS